jgi:hypothetical protein
MLSVSQNARVIQPIMAAVMAPSRVPFKLKYKDITMPIYDTTLNASQLISNISGLESNLK